MLAYVIRRAGQSVLVLLAMAILVFVGVYAIGNPIDIMISPDADQAEIEAAIRRLGLDKPLYEQFWIFLTNALQGDLGNSFVFSRPATEVILERMPATLELAALALILSVALGIPLGVIAGMAPDRPHGKAIMAGSILGLACRTSGRG
jgi:peptide/nickel transport system permease protein